MKSSDHSQMRVIGTFTCQKRQSDFVNGLQRPSGGALIAFSWSISAFIYIIIAALLSFGQDTGGDS